MDTTGQYKSSIVCTVQLITDKFSISNVLLSLIQTDYDSVWESIVIFKLKFYLVFPNPSLWNTLSRFAMKCCLYWVECRILCWDCLSPDLQFSNWILAHLWVAIPLLIPNSGSCRCHCFQQWYWWTGTMSLQKRSHFLHLRNKYRSENWRKRTKGLRWKSSWQKSVKMGHFRCCLPSFGIPQFLEAKSN